MSYGTSCSSVEQTVSTFTPIQAPASSGSYSSTGVPVIGVAPKLACNAAREPRGIESHPAILTTIRHGADARSPVHSKQED